jgi:hypothetical protein
MFTPELLLLSGMVMVIGSLVALAIAQSTRNWFFYGDPHAEWQTLRNRR